MSKNKKLIFTYGIYQFFDDMTYRCDHWSPLEDYTDIVLEESDILYKHKSSKYWYRFTDQSTSAEIIPFILKGFRDHAEKLLIEGDDVDTK